MDWVTVQILRSPPNFQKHVGGQTAPRWDCVYMYTSVKISVRAHE